MLKREERFLSRSGVLAACALILIASSRVWAQATPHNSSGKDYKILLPLIVKTPDPLTGAESVMDFLNYMRFHAGVPAAVDDPVLDQNCFEHARYMAENDVLTHQQNPKLPFSSPAGQICAKRANTWLGTESPYDPWQPLDALLSWRTSVAHRLWMLYPTTTVFGFGFYATDKDRGGAAIDVLSTVDFDADQSFRGWPVKYPGPGQRNIPAIDYPITLNWRYFGPKPDLYAVRLTTEDGTKIPFKANTDLDAGHKGIQILPSYNLPEHTQIKVYVSGAYEGRSFNYAWQFTTGASGNSITNNRNGDTIDSPQPN